MNIKHSLTELIGHTPLLEVCGYERKYNLKATILVKLESMNPAGSAKDRVALSMIEDAEASGRLKPGGTIVEPTSGNTGIGLAAVACAKGYRVILTMPDTMSAERRKLLAAYGAEIILTEGKKGMAGSIEKAEEIVKNTPGAIMAGQFDNKANPATHYRTTGPEIFADTDGTLDFFVAGIGTGGTLSGTGRYLKEQNPQIQVIGFEPLDSPLITEGKAGAHALQGIGANFIPKNFDSSVCDEVFTVSTEEAFTAGRELARLDGILAGITSGAALSVARRLAERPENAGKLIVALLPDTGDRYLSTGLFQ